MHLSSITLQTFRYQEQASKRPYEPFGAKPARASTLIGVSILMDTEALAGFAQGPRRSAGFGAQHYLNTIERRCPCGHREARKGFGVQLYRHTSERRTPCGLSVKRPVGSFGSLFLIWKLVPNICRLGNTE